MISTKNITPEKKLFHNEKINVYPTNVPIEEITFWKENLRTMLSFTLLQKEYKKKLPDIPLSDIVDYLAKQRALKITKLAESIEMNGVRVPLIILEKDGTLLDGNRRYFACQYLLNKSQNENTPRPAVLDSIPVWVIKDKDIDFRKQQKVLAEANFVPDYKVEWSLDVKARVIYRYFRNCITKKGMSREKAYEEVRDVYGVESETIDAYIDSVRLSLEFVKSAPSDEKNRYREIVQDKFVYFWEFRDKAYTIKMALKEKEIKELKGLFFVMMSTDRFKKMKQIEPMIRSIRDDYSWKILIDSSGSKIDQIEAMYMEQKAIKSAEDKIRNFQRWLHKYEISNFSTAAIKLLRMLAKECQEIVQKINN